MGREADFSAPVGHCEMTNKKRQFELRSNIPLIALSPQRTKFVGDPDCDEWGTQFRGLDNPQQSV